MQQTPPDTVDELVERVYDDAWRIAEEQDIPDQATAYRGAAPSLRYQFQEAHPTLNAFAHSLDIAVEAHNNVRYQDVSNVAAVLPDDMTEGRNIVTGDREQANLTDYLGRFRDTFYDEIQDADDPADLRDRVVDAAEGTNMELVVEYWDDTVDAWENGIWRTVVDPEPALMQEYVRETEAAYRLADRIVDHVEEDHFGSGTKERIDAFLDEWTY